MNIIKKFKYYASDINVMVKRNILHAVRNLESLLTTIMLPPFIMLIFVYIFGGVIDVGTANYIDYLFSGIIIISVAFSASIVAVGVNKDVTTGIIDRFRTMNISKSAIFFGHVFASLIRNVISILIIALLAFLIGFDTSATFLDWLLITGMILLFIFSFTWMFVMVSLLAKSPESASGFSMIVVFTSYISSAFVPTDTMPAALRIIAENQPFTHINDTLRALFLGNQVGNSAILAIIWWVVIFIVSFIVTQIIINSRNLR